MNINWFSFYHKMRIISVLALILSSVMLAFYLLLGTNNMFGTNPYDAMPYLIVSLLATIFTWLMEVKYKTLRNIPETSTKNERATYGIIGSSIILLFAAFLVYLPMIRP